MGRLRLGLCTLAMVVASCGDGGPSPADPLPTPAGPLPTSTVPTTTLVDPSTAPSATSAPPAPSTSRPPERVVTLHEPALIGFAEIAGVRGGVDGDRYVVTSVADSGPGTYRNALSTGDRYVVFAADLDGAVIDLASPVLTEGSRITIDASGVDITVTGYSTKFSGTDIVIAGMNFVDVTGTSEEDAVTFRSPESTQVFALFGNTFQTASDGLVDIIWNNGNDVHATICGNEFLDHNKAMLVHSGSQGREGGRYHLTMCRNHWRDIEQRAPLSRDAFVHQVNSVFTDFGAADGNGGGSKAGSGEFGAEHRLENNMAIPRVAGSTTWRGDIVTEVRTEFAGPTLSAGGRIRIDGSFLSTRDGITATENERSRDEVFDPPGSIDRLAASASLARAVSDMAGTCPPQESVAVNPCLWPMLVENGSTFTVSTSAPVDGVEVFVGDQLVATGSSSDGISWSIELDLLPFDENVARLSGELVAVARTLAGPFGQSVPRSVVVV